MYTFTIFSGPYIFAKKRKKCKKRKKVSFFKFECPPCLDILLLHQVCEVCRFFRVCLNGPCQSGAKFQLYDKLTLKLLIIWLAEQSNGKRVEWCTSVALTSSQATGGGGDATPTPAPPPWAPVAAAAATAPCGGGGGSPRLPPRFPSPFPPPPRP
jgi:hypothetical protein